MAALQATDNQMTWKRIKFWANQPMDTVLQAWDFLKGLNRTFSCVARGWRGKTFVAMDWRKVLFGNPENKKLTMYFLGCGIELVPKCGVLNKILPHSVATQYLLLHPPPSHPQRIFRTFGKITSPLNFNQIDCMVQTISKSFHFISPPGACATGFVSQNLIWQTEPILWAFGCFMMAVKLEFCKIRCCKTFPFPALKLEYWFQVVWTFSITCWYTNFRTKSLAKFCHTWKCLLTFLHLW